MFLASISIYCLSTSIISEGLLHKVVAILKILAMLELSDLPFRILLEAKKHSVGILPWLFLKINLLISLVLVIPRKIVSFGSEPLVVPWMIFLKVRSLVIILPAFIFFPVKMLPLLKRQSLLEVRLTIKVCLLPLVYQIEHLILLTWKVEMRLICDVRDGIWGETYHLDCCKPQWNLQRLELKSTVLELGKLWRDTGKLIDEGLFLRLDVIELF